MESKCLQCRYASLSTNGLIQTLPTFKVEEVVMVITRCKTRFYEFQRRNMHSRNSFRILFFTRGCFEVLKHRASTQRPNLAASTNVLLDYDGSMSMFNSMSVSNDWNLYCSDICQRNYRQNTVRYCPVSKSLAPGNEGQDRLISNQMDVLLIISPSPW